MDEDTLSTKLIPHIEITESSRDGISIPEVSFITSEFQEVPEESHQEPKTKIELLVELGKGQLRSAVLSDCYSTDRPGMHLEILPKIVFEDEDTEGEIDSSRPILRQTIDQGTQASVEHESNEAQTTRNRMLNSWAQCEPRVFTPQECQEQMSSAPFSEFLAESVEKILDALTQNSIADSFSRDLNTLYEKVESKSSKKESVIELHALFVHLESDQSNNMITSISWHSTCKTAFVASHISTKSSEEKIKSQVEELPNDLSYYIWNIYNQFYPKAVLEYSDNIKILKFNPTLPNLIVGGSFFTGELILWEIDVENLEEIESDESHIHLLSDQPKKIACFAKSSMDYMHKHGITHVEWLPSFLEVLGRGVIKENFFKRSFQIISCGLDGYIHFWDLRMGLQDKPGQPMPKTFHHLSFEEWEPFHSIEVLAKDGKHNKSITSFTLRRFKMTRKKEAKLNADDIDADNGESAYSDFYAGCDDGQVLCGNFKLVRDESGKFFAKTPDFYNSPHNKSVIIIACSPFLDDVFISGGGKTLALWKHEIKEKAIFLLKRPSDITSGCWSPTRPAVFLLGLSNGAVEVWDFHDDIYEPRQIVFISSHAITSIAFQKISDNNHVIAAGDFCGVTYNLIVLQPLWEPFEQELKYFEEFVSMEVKRVNDLIAMREANKKPSQIKFKSLAKEMKSSKQVLEYIPGADPEVRLANRYENLLKLESKIMKDLYSSKD